VKAFDTEEALQAAAPLIAPETRLLSFQNGLGNVEKLMEATDPNRVVGGVTSQGATEIEPGVIHHAGRGDSFIAGVPSERPSDLMCIKELLDGAGIPTEIAEDLDGLLWGKLLINVGINALTAIFRLPNGGLLASDEIRAIMGDVVQEAAAVAEARGIRLPYADPRVKVEEVARKTATNLSSMLQDVRKKRKTEIGAINGAIVREAVALDLPVPVNGLLVRIVKAIEACYGLGSVDTSAVG
jgi:2-dehydropantoate 2-reductase